MSLGAAETQRLDLRAITQAAHLAGTEGGVTVLVPSGGGNLITSHIVFDETTGMSATMKSFERDPAEKPRLHTVRAPMMALGNPDPVPPISERDKADSPGFSAQCHRCSVARGIIAPVAQPEPERIGAAARHGAGAGHNARSESGLQRRSSSRCLLGDHRSEVPGPPRRDRAHRHQF